MTTAKEYTDTFVKGIRPETVVQKTGHSWEEWDKILDEWDVKKNGSAASARHLREQYNVSMWWSNTIISRYRTLKGLR